MALNTLIVRIYTRDAPHIWPDNPAFFDILYPAGYNIVLPDIRKGRILDIRPDIRLMLS
jgi:hypothetical protein